MTYTQALIRHLSFFVVSNYQHLFVPVMMGRQKTRRCLMVTATVTASLSLVRRKRSR